MIGARMDRHAATRRLKPLATEASNVCSNASLDHYM